MVVCAALIWLVGRCMVRVLTSSFGASWNLLQTTELSVVSAAGFLFLDEVEFDEVDEGDADGEAGAVKVPSKRKDAGLSAARCGGFARGVGRLRELRL